MIVTPGSSAGKTNTTHTHMWLDYRDKSILVSYVDESHGYGYHLPVNEEIPNSTWANFKGFPKTTGLMSPPKDAKENHLLNL